MHKSSESILFLTLYLAVTNNWSFYRY